MAIPKNVHSKLEKIKKRRVLDAVRIPFNFDLDKEGIEDFSVGCSKWTLTVFFGDAKQKKEVTKNLEDNLNENDSTNKEELTNDQKMLFIKITNLTDEKLNYKILAFGSISLQSTEPIRFTRRNHSPSYREKFEFVFTNVNPSKMIYNFAPRGAFNGTSFVHNGSFKLVLKLAVRSFNVNRLSKFDFKKSDDGTPRWDTVLKIEKEDKDYAFRVNKQYICMHSNFLKECIEKAENAKNTAEWMEVELINIEPVELRDFLNIIYPSAHKLRSGHLPTFLKLAEKFQSEMLKEICSAFILDNMHRFKNDQLLRFADKYGLITVKARVLKMIDTPEAYEGVKKACDSGKLSQHMKKLMERKESFSRYYSVAANQALKNKLYQGPRGVSKKKKLLKKKKGRKEKTSHRGPRKGHEGSKATKAEGYATGSSMEVD